MKLITTSGIFVTDFGMESKDGIHFCITLTNIAFSFKIYEQSCSAEISI